MEVIKDKQFKMFIPHQEIIQKIEALAKKIDEDYANQELLLVGVLNGSFRFLADLVSALTIHTEVSFIRVSSYKAMKSTGAVQEILGLKEDISGRNVLLVEDIVDTGTTLAQLIELLGKHNPNSLKVASLLFKPEALQKDVKIDYVCFEIPNKFVVGYGLDYDNMGRSLNDILVLAE